MKLHRIGAILMSLVIGLTVSIVSVAVAQEGNPEDQGPEGTPSSSAAEPAVVLDVPSDFRLFAGTGAFSDAGAHDAHVISVTSGAAITAFANVSVWGATYDPSHDRVLFTSYNGGSGGEGNALWQWPFSGGTPTQLGLITGTSGLVRMDGLAFVNDTLYGWQQFARPGGDAGLYEIDVTTPPTFVVTPVFTTTDSGIGGIDADLQTGKLYGVNDSVTELVEMDFSGTMTTVASYPDATEVDIDGLAIGNNKAYLVPDDNAPGLIYVYDFNAMTYTAPITAPWTAEDTFSGGAFRAVEAISGLAATNDSPTVLGNPTTLTATVTAGQLVSYTWLFGDGTGGQGMVVTHTYPAPGAYAVTVTATNPVSVLTATTTVTVDEAISGLLATNDSPTVLGNPTTLTATVAAGSNVNFSWLFGDGATGAGATLTHTYPATGIYTAVVTAANSVSTVTAATTVTVVEPEYRIYVPASFGRYPATTAFAGQLVAYDTPLALPHR